MGLVSISLTLMPISSNSGDYLLNSKLVQSDTGVRFYMCKMIMNPPPLNWNHAWRERRLLPLSAKCLKV